jgi:hypothetical protein
MLFASTTQNLNIECMGFWGIGHLGLISAMYVVKI